jgi:hypothetical protein
MWTSITNIIHSIHSAIMLKPRTNLWEALLILWHKATICGPERYTFPIISISINVFSTYLTVSTLSVYLKYRHFSLLREIIAVRSENHNLSTHLHPAGKLHTFVILRLTVGLMTCFKGLLASPLRFKYYAFAIKMYFCKSATIISASK